MSESIIGGWAEKIADWIGDKVAAVFRAIVDWTEPFLQDTLDAIDSLLPAGWQPAFAELVPYMGVVNAWVPIDYMVVLMGMYFPIVGFLIALKTVLKFIPTIG